MKDEKKKGNAFGIKDFSIKAPNQKKFDTLEPAIINGEPQFKVGDRIIVQRDRGDRHIGVCDVINLDSDSCNVYDMTLGQWFGWNWPNYPDVRLPE